MKTGLEALEKINHTVCLNVNNGTLVFGLDNYEQCDCKSIYEFVDCYGKIEKELKDKETNDKVLKIIIDKDVTIGAIKALTFKEYNMYAKQVGTKMLTREEYELLKEVLINE